MNLTADTWRQPATILEFLAAVKTNLEVNRQTCNELTNIIQKEARLRPSYKEISAMISTDPTKKK